MDPVSAIGLGISAISTGFGIFGASRQDSAARRQQQRQYEYDTQAYNMGRQRLDADYRYRTREVDIARLNEDRLARFRDRTNTRDYNHALRIADFTDRQNTRQFQRSEQIYGQQLSFNRLAANAAREAEFRRLEDSTNEIAFQNQDIIIKAMEAEGAAAAKGQSGRSARKSGQAVLASLGRNQAILAESLMSARGETSSALRKISSDLYGANIAAEAARMLEPERAPRPPQPLRTPRTRFINPRQPREFDYGPRPIRGAATTSLPGAVASGLSSLGSSIAGLATQPSPNMQFNTGTPSNSVSVNPFSRQGVGTNALGGV